jgi:hypothetical protein
MNGVDSKIKNGILVWTMTTNGYKYLTLNLYTSIQRLKVPWNLMIVACDKESYNFFKRESIPVVLYPNAGATAEMNIARWGSPNFSKYNFMKLNCLSMFAKNPLIQTCVYLDGDIVIFKDFMPDILSRLDTAPETLLFQCDEKEPTVCSPGGCINCCTGFIAWRHGADKGVFTVNDSKKWSEHPDDQLWVNRELRAFSISYITVPRNLYPNGVFIPVIKTLAAPFLLHFNHRVGPTKIVEMKKLGHWLIPY